MGSPAPCGTPDAGPHGCCPPHRIVRLLIRRLEDRGHRVLQPDRDGVDARATLTPAAYRFLAHCVEVIERRAHRDHAITICCRHQDGTSVVSVQTDGIGETLNGVRPTHADVEAISRTVRACGGRSLVRRGAGGQWFVLAAFPAEAPGRGDVAGRCPDGDAS